MRREAEAPSARRSSSIRVVVLLGFIALVPFSLPTLLLMFVGMLPTLVAALTDRSGTRYAWICVGGLNFAGLAPALMSLWFGHHEISFALRQVTTISILLTAYGAAGCGWLLYMSAPPVVTIFMVATARRRAVALAEQQRKLVEIWGEEVASARSPAGGDIPSLR